MAFTDPPATTHKSVVRETQEVMELIEGWAEYLRARKRLDEREHDKLRVAIEETKSRMLLLAAHWYETGRHEPRLFGDL